MEKVELDSRLHLIRGELIEVQKELQEKELVLAKQMETLEVGWIKTSSEVKILNDRVDLLSCSILELD
jgi:hypothetical protein